MRLPNTNKILFGGDYNPEQWPEEIWNEDMKLFKEAHVDTVTLNVFSWAMLQPSENEYDFSKLDSIMDKVEENGLKVIMTTSTAAEPAWMVRKFPDTVKTDPDGKKRHFGGRQNICPNSQTFRKYAPKLAGELAKRYMNRKSIVAWHISNEYCGYCYCENCTKKFRTWLKEKYGTIDAVNDAWNTSFWSHTYFDFEDIVLPDFLSEEFNFGGPQGPLKSNFQGMSLDYRRFMDDSFLECYDLEKEAIRQYTPSIPCTTNFMGGFNQFDYAKWAKEMDFIAWDNYPSFDQHESDTSFWHDLMRGIKDGESFSLIEQTPGISNWHPYCALKRPGVMRLWSYQAIARGADTVLFFQMRRSVGACEKTHSALIDHVGTNETRVFKEMKELGEELDKLGEATLEGRSSAQAAMVFDFTNWWATGLSAGPSVDVNYLDEIHTWYKFFFDNNIPVDIVSPLDDISGYKLVMAPMLYLSSLEFADKIRSFTKNGGNFVTSYFSGYANENDKIYLGGYPAPWRDILGIWVEESDALIPERTNSFMYSGKRHECKIVCDLCHLEGAVSLGEYEKDFYKGMPVVTANSFGDGRSYYVGTRSEDDFYQDFLGEICNGTGILPICDSPKDVEVTRRSNKNGTFMFFLNHTDKEQCLGAPCNMTDLLTGKEYLSLDEIKMPAKGVVVAKVKM